MPLRLHVIDGADKGRSFLLPQSGVITVGKTASRDAICLHDLYVASVHCRIEVNEDDVVVTDGDKTGGTLVNGKKVSQIGLHAGDVLRVGNSHLRLEVGTVEPMPDESREATAPAGTAPRTDRDELAGLSGRTLGHFQVGAVLGRGFHGVVFEARDINKDQAVALKILRPPFPVDEKEMSQFTQTLKTILPLRHPHLLAVYGAGKAGSYCWIAREPVEGKTLAQILARVASQRKLNWLNGLRVAIHVGRALHYLHEHRVMHGDVTPHNILVRSKDKHTSLYNVMLLKALEGSRLQEQTLEGKLLAELGYLAPEQADPDAFVDELNDIYGLGAVVYARLTGRPPFQGDSPEETLTNIREGPLVKPRKIQPSIPEPMERVVLRMLARRQEDRYQNVADVVADLDRIAQKEGVQL